MVIHPLARPKEEPAASKSAKRSLFISSVFTCLLLAMTRSSNSTECAYCGPHVPTPEIRTPYVVVGGVYILLAAVIARRHRRLVMGAFPLFLGCLYLTVGVSIFLIEGTNSIDAGYCSARPE